MDDFFQNSISKSKKQYYSEQYNNTADFKNKEYFLFFSAHYFALSTSNPMPITLGK